MNDKENDRKVSAARTALEEVVDMAEDLESENETMRSALGDIGSLAADVTADNFQEVCDKIYKIASDY